uniref:Uncharacterized protein n=1 Tax=Cannabis sativa TaxID=3483 RepID=A0A803QSI9_CANSA
GLATYPFGDFGVGRSQNGYYRDWVNSIIGAVGIRAPFSLGAYQKEILGCEYHE